MKFKVGSRVKHHGHGLGTVVKLNNTPKNLYFQEKPMEATRMAGKAGLIAGLVNSLYDGDRYPYVVKFDKGYQDVYAETELMEVK